MPAHKATLAYSWLLLIHQLPAKPAYLRVKIRRRLQDLGAVAVKNAVHALPMNEETQEDFEWLLREIVEGGGEAIVCEARLIDGLSDQEVRALFDQARDADYEDVAKDVRALAKLRANAKPDAIAERRIQVARLRKRLAQVVSIDFFGAIGREKAEGLLRGLEARLSEGEDVKDKASIDSGEGAFGHAARQNLGHAAGRLCGSDRQRLVDTPLHRPASSLQIRIRQGVSPARWRAALRHVRGRVHA